MTRQSCEACEFFAPAHRRTERPTWGQCMKLVEGKIRGSTAKPRPLFTWADHHCDDFQVREPSAVRR